jgi:hypothetical protein
MAFIDDWGSRQGLQKLGGLLSVISSIPIFIALVFLAMLHLNLTPFMLKTQRPPLPARPVPNSQSPQSPSNHIQDSASELSKSKNHRKETQPAAMGDFKSTNKYDTFWQQLIHCKISKTFTLARLLPLILFVSLVSCICDAVAKLTPGENISDRFCDNLGVSYLEFYALAKTFTYEFFALKVLIVMSAADDSLKKTTIKICIAILTAVFAFYILVIPLTWQGFVATDNICGLHSDPARKNFADFVVYSWPPLDALVTIPLLYAFLRPLISADKSFSKSKYKDLIKTNIRAGIVSMASTQAIIIVIIANFTNQATVRFTSSLFSLELSINALCLMYTMKRSWILKKTAERRNSAVVVMKSQANIESSGSKDEVQKQHSSSLILSPPKPRPDASSVQLSSVNTNSLQTLNSSMLSRAEAPSNAAMIPEIKIQAL